MKSYPYYKYKLSGSHVVEGEKAELIFNKIKDLNLLSGFFLVYWKNSNSLATIRLSLQSISAVFDVKDIDRETLLDIISEITREKPSNNKSSKEIYREMLEQVNEISECAE